MEPVSRIAFAMTLSLVVGACGGKSSSRNAGSSSIRDDTAVQPSEPRADPIDSVSTEKPIPEMHRIFSRNGDELSIEALRLVDGTLDATLSSGVLPYAAPDVKRATAWGTDVVVFDLVNGTTVTEVRKGVERDADGHVVRSAWQKLEGEAEEVNANHTLLWTNADDGGRVYALAPVGDDEGLQATEVWATSLSTERRERAALALAEDRVVVKDGATVYWLDIAQNVATAHRLAELDSDYARVEALLPNTVLLDTAHSTLWLRRDGQPFSAPGFSQDESVVTGAFAELRGRLALLREEGAIDLQPFAHKAQACTFAPCGLVAARESPQSPLALATAAAEPGGSFGRAFFVTGDGREVDAYAPPESSEGCLRDDAIRDLNVLEHTSIAADRVYLALGVERWCAVSQDQIEQTPRYDFVSFDTRTLTSKVRSLVAPSGGTLPSHYDGAFRFSPSGEFLLGVAGGKVQLVTVKDDGWRVLAVGQQALGWPVH